MKTICMPECLYNLGVPFEMYQECVNKNGVFIPNKKLVKFVKKQKPCNHR